MPLQTTKELAPYFSKTIQGHPAKTKQFKDGDPRKSACQNQSQTTEEGLEYKTETTNTATMEGTLK
jgi:hypothetical protein